MFVKKTTQLSRAPGARVALELGGLAPLRELAVELLELEQHFAFAEVHEVVVGAERIHGRGRGGARRARRGGRAARVARPGSLKAAGPPSSQLWLTFGLLGAAWPSQPPPAGNSAETSAGLGALAVASPRGSSSRGGSLVA